MESTPSNLEAEEWRKRHLRRRWQLVIFVYGLSLLFMNLGSGRVLTRHEVFTAQPAREMLHGGNLIVPSFLGKPRAKKPPTMSWLIAASMALFRSQAEWVARLPSVLAAILTALLIGSLAAQWFDELTGLLAGLMQCAVVYVFIQARLAEADMPLCAAVTAAMYFFALGSVSPLRTNRARIRRWLPSAFYLATGFAFLLKGPVGAVFVLAATISFAVLRRLKYKEATALRFLLDPLGLFLFVLCVAWWPLAAYLQNPSIYDVWMQQIFGRMVGKRGSQPFLFYFYTIPWLLLPWTPLAAWSLVRGHRWVFRKEGQFLLCWWIGFLVLQISAFKHKHYIIPLLPPVSLAAARGMLDYLAKRYTKPRPRIWGFVSVWVMGGFSGFGAVWWLAPELQIPLTVLILLATMGFILVAVLESRKQLKLQLGAIFTVVWLIGAGFFLFIMPHFDSYRTYANLAGRALRQMQPGESLYLLGLGETQIAYYLPLTTHRSDSLGQFIRQIKKEPNKQALVIINKRMFEYLSAKAKVTVLDKAELRHKREEESRRLMLLKTQLP